MASFLTRPLKVPKAPPEGHGKGGRLEHPFGRENEVSLRQLFNFFCNNLQLGQWELARACIDELHGQRELLQVSVRDKLRSIAENPYGYSLGSESIATPHHLSWLCLHEFERLDASQCKELVSVLRQDVEFRLLLVEACRQCDPILIKELYEYHRSVFSSMLTGQPQSAGRQLPLPCEDWLTTLLSTDPSLGHALLQQLTGPDTEHFQKNNSRLQGIHLRCLQASLTELRYLAAVVASDQAPLDPNLQASLTKHFTDLLCLFNPKPSLMDLALTHFLEELLEFLSQDGARYLSLEVVYSALLGREDTFLLEEFCKIEHDERMRAHRAVGRSVAGADDLDLCERGHQVLGLCYHGDRDQAWRDLFLTSLKHDRHFLDLIMDTALNLVKTGQFERLSAMLAPDELRPLRPLVLLVGWDHCSHFDDAKQLLQAMGSCQDPDQSGMVLDDACCRLSHQVELVQWCLDQVRSIVPLDDSSSYPQKAASLLRGLETLSVLHMLHRTTRLRDLDDSHIFTILMKRPVMEQRSKEKHKKEKNVRFSLDAEAGGNRESPKAKREPINVELERDIAIYRSYCATKHFMDAFHFCADTVNWEIYNTAQAKQAALTRDRAQSLLTPLPSHQSSAETNRSLSGFFSRSVSMNSSASSTQHEAEDRVRGWSVHRESSIDIHRELDTVKEELESFQAVYTDKVVCALQAAREHLSKLHPLTLRVETLENLFSLLFLTNENIQEEDTGVSDSGEEGAVSESRASSRENLEFDPAAPDGEVPRGDFPSSRSSLTDDNTPLWSTRRRHSTEGSVPAASVNVVIQPDSPLHDGDMVLKQDPQGMKTTSVGIFSFSTMELKDTSSDIAKKNSGNLSTNSAGSTGSVYKVGFIANEYIVRDVLATFKDCLLDLNAAKFRLMGQQRFDLNTKQTNDDSLNADQELEDILSQHVLTSVERAHLQQRIGRLSQYVSEATWRFQLVSHDWLPSETGKIMLEKPTVVGEGFSDEETGGFYSDDDEGGRRKKRRRGKSGSGKEGVLSAGESESIQTTDESVASSGSHTRWGPPFQYGPGGGQSTLSRRYGIVPLMLADQQTLLHMCLRRAKYGQAQQVVKMFGLERASSAAEVVFAEQYSSAVRKLQSLDHAKSAVKPGGGALSLPRLPRPGAPGRVSLSAIAKVAAAGVVTVSATSTVDQVLSLDLLPSFPPDVLEDVRSSASPLASHIDPHMIPAMIIIDLISVGSKLWESSQNLTQMLKRRLPHGEKTSAKSPSHAMKTTSDSVNSDLKKSGSPPFGVRDFMDLIIQYVFQGASEAHTEVAERFLKKGFNEALLTGTQPLNPMVLRNYAHVIVDIDRCIKRGLKALLDSKKQETMSLLQAVRSSNQGGAPKSEKPVIRQAVKHLMMSIVKNVPAEGIGSYLLRDVVEPKVENSGDYLGSLYDHVKALSCLVNDGQGEENVSSVEYFKMLEEGPTQIMGKLIFIRMLPPASLEDVARKLHVNLLQIIINNCCPSIPSQPLPLPLIDGCEQAGGKLVLNASVERSGSLQHPGTLVTEVLTRLILVMKEYTEQENSSGIFTLAVTTAVVVDPRYLQLMATTAQLKYVDVSLLESQEDKLCFYGNLLNLMILHVVLFMVERKVSEMEENVSCGANHPPSCGLGLLQGHSGVPGSLSRQLSSGSPGPKAVLQRAGGLGGPPVDMGLPATEVDWVLLQMRMAYHVGQLGVVSLFDLRHFILRTGLPAPSSTAGIIEDRCHGSTTSKEPPELEASDPWRQYGPEPEPRMLFVISDGHRSSPPLQVLSREMVLTQLRVAMKDYLQHSVTIDPDTNKITLPQLLASHHSDFASEYLHGALPYEGLLNFILTQADGTLENELKAILNKHTAQLQGVSKPRGSPSLRVRVSPYNTDFTYTFDFTHYASAQTAAPYSGHQRSTSLPNNKTIIGVNGSQTEPSKEDLLFHLSPASVSYLRSKSDLVATLASLVGVTARDDPPKNTTGEASTPGSPVSPSATPEDEGEYTGQEKSESPAKLDFDESIDTNPWENLISKFPTLWRHIQKQIVPLEVAQHPSLACLSPEELAQTFSEADMADDMRKAMLASSNGTHMGEVLLKVSKIMIQKREWLGVVNLLQSVPVQVLHSNPEIVNIHDLACCCVAYTSGLATDSTDTDSNDLWRHLLQVYDPDTRGRSVLGLLKCWPVDVSVELLRGCESYHSMNPGLATAVGERLSHMLIYQQVTECAQNLRVKSALTNNLRIVIPFTNTNNDEEEEDEEEDPVTMDTGELNDAILERLCVWQNVMTDTCDCPERILQVLLQSNEYVTARKWAALHQVAPHLQQDIERKYITFLLEAGKPNYAKSFQVLERLQGSDSEECMRLCDILLQDLTNKANTLFVASYMTHHLTDHLNKYRLEDLHLLAVGCKALLCLPEMERPNYDHLVAQPTLLLEQLLMNRKIDSARQVLTSLRSSQKSSTTTSLTLASCDKLLEKYASMALEFAVVCPGEASPVLSRSESRISISSQVSQMSYASQASAIVSPRNRTQSLTPLAAAVLAGAGRGVHKSQSSNRLSLLRTQVPGAVGFSLSTQKSLASSPKCGTGRSVARSPPNMTAREMIASPGGSFVMPPEPPNREHWVPDSAATVCMVCTVERFSMFIRRHHCRRCGRVVCGSCSTRTMVVRGTSARACDQCYMQSFRPKDADELTKFQKRKEKLSAAVTPPGGEDFVGAEEQDLPPGAHFLSEYVYVLSLDEELNDLTREEFYYDQAPSTSLSLSILELHSDPQQCGGVILQLCDDVSCHLQPLAPGVKNPEVDYGFVISMLKYLLFNAKMKFLQTGDNQGVGQCDVYLARLDIVKQLVAANCAYIPSMQQLTKMDALRRLRDKLIEEERLSLAMDVSTKCGIDPAGVWGAWGLACLRAGDFTAARDKFSHCLKAPVDKNQVQQSSQLLTDIIGQLERGPPPAATQAGGLLAQLGSIKDLLAEPPMLSPSDSSLEDPILKECLYYLSTYGTHVNILAFHLRRHRLQQATHYMLDKQCSRDVFLEGVVMPCLVAGHLVRLLDQMLQFDPTLDRWSHYLTAVCRHFDKLKLVNTLYQTQLFIKDYIRAAMTCITYLYQRGALGYGDLFRRLQHLLNAKQHMEAYLSERQWGERSLHAVPPRHNTPNWGRRGSQPEGATLKLIMIPGEVNKYVNTINLQIDVTKFLHRYTENLEAVVTVLRTSQSSVEKQRPATIDAPPTLFGSTRMKAEVANLVLLAGNNVNDGFGLAFRIIQDFKLDSTFIYVQSGRFFARQHKYNSVRQLLSCIKDSGLSTEQGFDEVIGACVKVIADEAAESKEAETLIKMIRSDSNKINAYIVCGKLRSAYLIAVKGDRVEDIRRICAVAERAGQMAVKKICDKWLQGRQKAEELLANR